MHIRKLSLFLVLPLLFSMINVTQAQAVPSYDSTLPMCGGAVTQYCIQSFQIKGGGLSSYTSAGTTTTNAGYTTLSNFSGYSPASGYTNSFVPDIYRYSADGGTTFSGIQYFVMNQKHTSGYPSSPFKSVDPDTTIKMVVNVGSIDAMTVAGNTNFSDFSINKSDVNNVLVTIEGNSITRWDRDTGDCSGSNGVSNGYTLGMFQGFILAGSDFSSLQGMWVADNAYCHSWPSFASSTNSRRETAIKLRIGGPHFQTDGTTLNSVFFKTRIPEITLTSWGISATEVLSNSKIRFLYGTDRISRSYSAISDGNNGVILSSVSGLSYSFEDVEIDSGAAESSGSGGGGGSPSNSSGTISTNQLTLSQSQKITLTKKSMQKVSFKEIVSKTNLKVKKGDSIKITLKKSSNKNCKIVQNNIVNVKTGKCQISVKKIRKGKSIENETVEISYLRNLQ